MLALHRAGLLQFLGPNLEISTDEADGTFRASSPQFPGTLAATAFIEARLPGTSVARSLNPALESLHRSGLGTEQQLLTADGIHSTGKLLVTSRHQLVDAQGQPQATVFAVGPGTSGWGAGAFARPGTNAAPFRENDALARIILSVARGLTAEPSAALSTAPAVVGKN